MCRFAAISYTLWAMVAMTMYGFVIADGREQPGQQVGEEENALVDVKSSEQHRPNISSIATHIHSPEKPAPLVVDDMTCPDVLRWIPPSADDLSVMVLQVVNKSYLAIQANFMAWMAKSSPYMMNNLYLLCLDDSSASFSADVGLRCVEVDGVVADSGSKNSVWILRMKVLECLLESGRDVLMSDNDAFWLKDPIPELAQIEGDLLAQRAPWPKPGDPIYGVSLCMGFALFRAEGEGMPRFQQEVARFMKETGDDQVSVNAAANSFEPNFDYNMSRSDMRYQNSTIVGKSVLEALPGTFEVAYLPHNEFTRDCAKTPVSRDTIVAHCHTWGTPERRVQTMKDNGVWIVEGL